MEDLNKIKELVENIRTLCEDCKDSKNLHIAGGVLRELSDACEYSASAMEFKTLSETKLKNALTMTNEQLP